MENEIALLDIAIQDHSSSQILFEKELYPQSIFFIQQAVEKSIKQLGIYNGVVKYSELQKEIGHKSEKIFKKVVGQVKHITGDSDTDIHKDYNQLKQLLKDSELSQIKDVIINALNENEKLEIPSDVIESLIDHIIKSERPDFFERLGENPSFEKEFIRMKENFVYYFPGYIKSVMILFHLNLVLSDYVSIVRYPSGDKFENPALIFNSGHPLVQLMPVFLMHCKFAIKGISDFHLMTKY